MLSAKKSFVDCKFEVLSRLCNLCMMDMRQYATDDRVILRIPKSVTGINQSLRNRMAQSRGQEIPRPIGPPCSCAYLNQFVVNLLRAADVLVMHQRILLETSNDLDPTLGLFSHVGRCLRLCGQVKACHSRHCATRSR